MKWVALGTLIGLIVVGTAVLLVGLASTLKQPRDVGNGYERRGSTLMPSGRSGDPTRFVERVKWQEAIGPFIIGETWPTSAATKPGDGPAPQLALGSYFVIDTTGSKVHRFATEESAREFVSRVDAARAVGR